MRLSLFLFLHVVALVILLIVHPHARAENGWTIEKHNKKLTYKKELIYILELLYQESVGCFKKGVCL